MEGIEVEDGGGEEGYRHLALIPPLLLLLKLRRSVCDQQSIKG